MLIKTLLNSVEKTKSFVYTNAYFEEVQETKSLIIEIKARKNTKGLCSRCHKKCPSYDMQPKRDYQFVPIWNMPTKLRYQARRVKCEAHGVVVEALPWAEGKERLTKSYKLYLATWAKRMSWQEVATAFGTNWSNVYRSVRWVVEYGLEHRNWENVKQIGVDEIAVFKRHRYLTCVYQLDQGMRRLLWCGKDRSVKTLLRFFRGFGEKRCSELEYVCTDMWRPYLKVVKKKCKLR